MLFTMNFLKLENCDLYYQETGSGDPVVLVHGMGSDHTAWGGLVPLLQTNYRVLAVDLRGHGYSCKTPGPYSLDLFATDLLKLLESLDIKKAHFLGHSMGGAVLLELALHHPEKMYSLTLISSFARVDPPLEKILNTLLKILSEQGYEAFFDACLPLTYTPEFLEENQESFSLIKATTRQMVSLTSLTDTLQACLQIELKDDLSEIDVPSLIIAGSEDTFTPPHHGIFISNNLKQGKMVIMEGVGHNLLVEQPEKTHSLIKDYLKLSRFKTD
ncbi:alpha/beta fold hydrolase [Methanobacterium formicicum]|uniref:Alpha/beta fold hydrolase n=1 Tax=Methanobacterium formicicum TaxID=2162 RepID=A0A843AQ04_METFO|nr:alpha/beta fold hydrolase [Methanobacterium formicicum]MBF4475896.1 alpha/beta fold hydrolase [Methanobacterium formicicum]